MTHLPTQNEFENPHQKGESNEGLKEIRRKELPCRNDVVCFFG